MMRAYKVLVYYLISRLAGISWMARITFISWTSLQYQQLHWNQIEGQAS